MPACPTRAAPATCSADRSPSRRPTGSRCSSSLPAHAPILPCSRQCWTRPAPGSHARQPMRPCRTGPTTRPISSAIGRSGAFRIWPKASRQPSWLPSCLPCRPTARPMTSAARRAAPMRSHWRWVLWKPTSARRAGTDLHAAPRRATSCTTSWSGWPGNALRCPGTLCWPSDSGSAVSAPGAGHTQTRSCLG